MAPIWCIRGGKNLIGITILAGWLAGLFWLAPSRVIPTGDDFGYIESVINTIRAQRIQASHWLEPLNLPLPGLSAICYAATGDFYISTVGMNLIIGALTLCLLYLFLAPVIHEDYICWAVAVGVCSLPVFLYKTVQYTAVPLGVASTLGAWLCWRRGCSVLFFACVLIGFFNRQSSLCLLAWPVVAVIRQYWRKRRFNWRIILGTGITLIVALGVYCTVPPTWARQIVNVRLLTGVSLEAFGGNIAVGLVVLVAGRVGWDALRGRDLIRICRNNLARPLCPIAFMMLGAGLYLGGYRISWETPAMGYVASFMVVSAVIFGAWFTRWTECPPTEAVVYVVAYSVLVSIRGIWWDYYFIEPLIALAPLSHDPVVRWWRNLVLGLFLTAGAAGLLSLKGYFTKVEAQTVAYERALRHDELRLDYLSDASFGFLGWKLFETARTREGATSLVDFLKFVEGARVRYEHGTVSIDDRIGWRFSLHPSKEKWALPPSYIDRPLPLDAQEWNAYIRERRE